MQSLLSIVLATSLSATSSPVSSRDDVNALAATADDAFSRGDFEAARNALLEALALEPNNPPLLFGLAQAERFLDNCPRAIELYDAFLAASPTPSQAEAAREKRAQCVPEPPEPPPPIVEAPAGSEPTQPPPSKPGRPRPHPAGPLLVGTGIILAAAGAGLLAASFSTARRAPDSATQGDYERRRRIVPGLAASGWSALGLGAAAIVTGGVVWGLRIGGDRVRMVWKTRPVHSSLARR